ncbi:unnamed protein product [Onchocerca flexuosa]|uniref:HAD hydrolase, family IIA n=1 Tax=Onchocerca flexuosa TaxID=387005 RepID=A0A183HWC5_9BILA|nr:unnamed protein product [Onchocerca flexuosa]
MKYFSGKNVFIVTNNSSKALDDFAAKCRRIGFDMISDDHMLSPAKVLSHILAMEKSDLPVYLVGSTGLQKELKKRGIESFGVGPDPIENYTDVESIQQIDISRKVRAVIVSYDIHISYPKIMRAASYINQPGVRFYATNPDPKLPGPVPGVVVPGSGVNVRAVETAAGKEPIIIGKPSKTMFEYIKERYIFASLLILKWYIVPCYCGYLVLIQLNASNCNLFFVSLIKVVIFFVNHYYVIKL